MSFPLHCLTFAEIAQKIGKPEVWTAALFYESAVTDTKTAQALVEALGPSAATYIKDTDGCSIESLVAGLSGKGTGSLGVEGMLVRGKGWEDLPPKDPVLYRLYEVLLVYGYSYKALIKEKFGDGIMSAIDFNTTVDRVPHPKGDRVKITMSGKYLPYSDPEVWAQD